MYEKLDAIIIAAIDNRKSPIYSESVTVEAGRIAAATGREDFRVIDLRLQALRKAGVIAHRTKAESNGQGGWHVVKRVIEAKDVQVEQASRQLTELDEAWRTLDSERAANARLTEESESLASNLRGKHATTGATYAHLIAERDRLRNENAKLRAAYGKMCNAAAGYSNCCEDSASVRRCEREYEEAEAMYRAIK